MKRLILILSYILGSIALLFLVCVFLYYNVWLQSFNNMNYDDDDNNYSTLYTKYCNGALTVKNPRNNTIEIITADSKKVIDLPETSDHILPYYFDEHIIVSSENSIIIYDTNCNKIDEINCNEDLIWLTFDQEHIMYYATDTKIYKFDLQTLYSEIIYNSLYSEMNDISLKESILLIGYVNENKTEYTLIKYSICDSKVINELNVKIGDFHLDEDSYCTSNICGNYIYFYITSENLDVYIYKYEISAKKIDFIGKFEYKTKNKDNFVYYIGTSNGFLTSENNPDEYGLWELDLLSMKTRLISNKVDNNCYFFCTKNYVYSYKLSYIGEDTGGSSPFHRVYRGYTIDQIPLQITT